MRDPCFFPLKASRARRFTASNLSTWSVTVFISRPPCSNVSPEIIKQRIRVYEAVGLFLVPKMPMVAFACLIVVAQYTYSADNKRQPVLKAMARATCRSWQMPNHDLDKRPRIKDVAF